VTSDDGRTDRMLWDDAVRGDRAAFGALFDRHARAVYNHCFRLTASWASAEDHVSATFLTAWHKREQVRLRHESALPWLLAVATNVVRSEHRSLRRRAALATRLTAEHAVPDHADDVAGRLDDQQRMRTVLRAVDRLPRAEREALALCAWSGVSYADAAAVLGIAEVSVRARVSKARSRLTRLLGSNSAELATVVALANPSSPRGDDR
jgi:RNA polymerase sigma factor (sigma-70 family)